MSYVDSEKIYVVTYKEIILFIIAFSVILFVLYPKEFLKDQILSENDNYDLSMLYLKNMLKNDPTNESLMMTLAKQSLETGKKDLSIHLLELLKQSENQKIREETYTLSYRLLKEDYFYLESIGDTEKLEKILKELKELMNKIVPIQINKDENIQKLYLETTFLKDTKNSYLLVKKILETKPNDLSLTKEAFYLSSKLSKEKEMMSYLDKLILLDKDDKTQWLEAKYYLLLTSVEYTTSERYLIDKSRTSPYWSKKLFNFYEYNKKYKKIANLEMYSFTKTSNKKEKRYHWLRAINALRNGKYMNESVALGKKYEDYFLNDKTARIELLNLYISTNELKKANILSKKILKRNFY